MLPLQETTAPFRVKCPNSGHFSVSIFYANVTNVYNIMGEFTLVDSILVDSVTKNRFDVMTIL